MEDLKKEIRRILLGYIAYRDNCIVAARESVKMRTLGTFNGTTMARLFGVSVITRRYRVAEDEEVGETLSKAERKKNRKNGDTKKKQLARKLFEDSDSAMQNLGRRVLLETEPERLATFYAPVLYNPSVLLLDFVEEEDAVEVTVVTARTVMARVNAAHAFWKWSKFLTFDVERLDLPEPEETPEEENVSEAPLDKDATKEEKKAYKEKKKALAAAKKQARQKQKLEAKMAKLQAAMDEQSAAISAKSDESAEETEE